MAETYPDQDARSDDIARNVRDLYEEFSYAAHGVISSVVPMMLAETVETRTGRPEPSLSGGRVHPRAGSDLHLGRAHGRPRRLRVALCGLAEEVGHARRPVSAFSGEHPAARCPDVITQAGSSVREDSAAPRPILPRQTGMINDFSALARAGRFATTLEPILAKLVSVLLASLARSRTTRPD